MSTERWTRCPNDQCSHIVSVSGKKKYIVLKSLSGFFFTKETVYKFVDLNDGIYFWYQNENLTNNPRYICIWRERVN